MWLPTSIYERAPQLWCLLGALFIALGLYIGVAYELIYFYLAVGVACCLRGFWVYRVRRQFRSARNGNDDPSTGDSPATPIGS